MKSFEADRKPAKRGYRMIPLLLALWGHQSPCVPGRDAAPPGDLTLAQEGCTIGVASAGATSDGRPLLWKIRDNSELPNNSISYDTSGLYRFIAVTNSGDREVWMGVNEMGLAIINSTALDLPGGTSGLNNGLLMQLALGMCASVGDFGLLLDSTNATGRRTQGNFGLVDSAGAAIMFEVGGSAYWRYDANDSTRASEGYVIRTNFSMAGGGNTGIERYRRAVAQIREFRLSGTLDYRRIMRDHARDFSDYSSNRIAVPYPRVWSPASPLGYFYSNVSVCRHKSISATAIVGVRSGEHPELSTMWAILGQPATGIAVPYWPIGNAPGVATGSVTSPLNDIANTIRSALFDFPLNPDYVDSYKLRDECGNGLWAVTFPAEDSIFDASDALLARWRNDPPSQKRMLVAESALASSAMSHLTDASDRLTYRAPFDVANSIPYQDANGKVLENGDIVQLIWVGEDGRIDPPNMDIGSPQWGKPTGDDYLIGVPHVMGENASVGGTFHFQMIGWTDRTVGFPAAGDLVYVRVFNSKSLETATRYGTARPYPVPMRPGNRYTPLIGNARTEEPLGKHFANDVGPLQIKLSQNFPNPFNSSTIIEFEIPYAGDLRGSLELTVFNHLGQTVRTLVSGPSPGGRQRMRWDGKDNSGQMQPSGVYYLRLKAGRTTSFERMLLLK